MNITRTTIYIAVFLFCSCDEPAGDSAERWDAFSADAAICRQEIDNVRQCAIKPRNNQGIASPIYDCLHQFTPDFTEPDSDLFTTWESCVSGSCAMWADLEMRRNAECNYTYGDLLDLCVYEMLGIKPDSSLNDECHWDIETSSLYACWSLESWCANTTIYAPGQGY